MTDPVIRRVRLQEWREVRDLRLRALRDPAAPIAFLSTVDEALSRDDAFWQQRTADAAMGEDAAQFVAVVGERWVGSVSVLLREAGATDTLGRSVDVPQADLVGVFIDGSHRGRGILDALVDAASVWAERAGPSGLTLDVHVENARARAAYARLGFAPTGREVETSSGREIQMHRPAR
ncbi:GNAT family N-acetyltransferase [Microbacterium sp. NPDC077663]|uniref:GNAT family N-acetyltransferase n=1 Tax=Microbacterium sp. NPDC077663 TaxID=3364189 RepID=UPI0037C8C264